MFEISKTLKTKTILFNVVENNIYIYIYRKHFENKNKTVQQENYAADTEGREVNEKYEVVNFTDTPANRDNYNLRRIQQLESMLTADEANVYYQLEDFQKDAFLQAIEENKISQYEAENFDRLRMPY